MQTSFHAYAGTAVALAALLIGADTGFGQQQKPIEAQVTAPPGAQADVSSSNAVSSVEQGQTPLDESFDFRQWRIEKRRNALRDTEFEFNFRTYYFDRKKFDGSESQAWAIGGWAGFKTGYFLDHFSFGSTVYTSQRLYGEDDKDGTLLLKPGQEGYTALGELYADIRVMTNLSVYIGRKEFDTPFINANDTRMTPNTFEAIALKGRADFSKEVGTLKYGAGYFNAIKERNASEFISMSKAAGADVDRGVFAAGAIYEKGKFSVGAYDYYSPDIINIPYAEAKLEVPICEEWRLRFATQFIDQRSVGNDSLQGDSFSAQQFGLKSELPVKQALFTVAYTQTTDGANMRSPWSGYPGYTSVQVQDFNRAGEGAFLIRAAYDFDVAPLKGLSAYALAVFGTQPDETGQYRQDEYDLNLQWTPPECPLKGLSLRLRYGLVQQHGGDVDDLQDFRVIVNYAFTF